MGLKSGYIFSSDLSEEESERIFIRKQLTCHRLARLCLKPYKEPRRIPLALFANTIFVDPRFPHHSPIDLTTIRWSVVLERLGL